MSFIRRAKQYCMERFAMIFRSISMFYNRLSSTKRKLCWIVTIGLASLISIVIMIVGVGHPKHPANYNFYTRMDITLPDNVFMGIFDDGKDECYKRCEDRPECVTVVYKDGNHLFPCHLYQHTPFYLNLKPIRSLGAEMSVKKSIVQHGMADKNGFWYYTSVDPMYAFEATHYCERVSDFYYLAVKSGITPIRRVAVNAYDVLKERPEGARYGIIIRNYVRTAPTGKIEIEFEYVTSEIEVISANTLGYALCAGDPFNTLGNAHQYRRVGGTS